MGTFSQIDDDDVIGSLPKSPLSSPISLSIRGISSAMATTSSDIYPPHDGDFVIQTSDAVLFGVHRLLLKLSSPVMSDMFALGATSSDQLTPGVFSSSAVPRDPSFDYFSTMQSRYPKILGHSRISCRSSILTKSQLSSRVSICCYLCSTQPANTR